MRRRRGGHAAVGAQAAPRARWRIRTLCSIGAAVLVGCADSGEPAGDGPDASTGTLVAEASLGPVTATLRMQPKEPRFGERVRFSLEVRAAAGKAVLAEPEVGARWGHFRVRGRERDGSAASGRLTVTVTTEPERTGVNICRTPAIPFTVVGGEGAGTERELSLDPFDVEVAGLPPHQQPDLAEFGAPLAAVPLPAGASGGATLWIGVAASLAVLGLAGLWWWRRRRGTVDAGAPTRDPGEEAAWNLQTLLGLDLLAQGRYGEFYVHLTGIVRRYIERTTGVHAPEQTTEEFLRAMEGHPSFEPEQRQRLSAFLTAADLVKFAARIPGTDEIDDAVGAARSFCGLDDDSSPEVAA